MSSSGLLITHVWQDGSVTVIWFGALTVTAALLNAFRRAAAKLGIHGAVLVILLSVEIVAVCCDGACIVVWMVRNTMRFLQRI